MLKKEISGKYNMPTVIQKGNKFTKLVMVHDSWILHQREWLMTNQQQRFTYTLETSVAISTELSVVHLKVRPRSKMRSLVDLLDAGEG